ncbi:DUF5753 domain-containing protein [Streptacidiphilus sp. MAP5-52]|uniref:DUF5753 domain-containing protein n=1 Tax=Streptacidiphilus sp. MAP5-52 TaxID=3156267 RepID=UPI003513F0CA
MTNETQRYADLMPDGSGLADLQDNVLSDYERATRLRSFSATGIPGWLQTAEYAHAMLTCFRRLAGEPGHDVDAAVASRRKREQLLRDGRRQVHSIIGQPGLRYVVGGDPGMLASALTHVLEAIDWPTCTIGVMPDFNYGPQIPPLGTFYLLDDTSVSLETEVTSTTITEPKDIAVYDRAFTCVAALAVYGGEAKAVIRGVINSLD